MSGEARYDEQGRIRGPIVITGTDTGVGKTIVTAAIAAAAGRSERVAVVKPGQTGIMPHGAIDESQPSAPRPESDVETVVRLAGPATALTMATYPYPLAPAAAARESGLPPVALADVVSTVTNLAGDHDLVLVEGAGGLLVPMGGAAPADWTLADLAVEVQAIVVVVARSGLGTLNHSALTLEALARRGLDAYVVIGEWPAEPELVHRTNLVDLPGTLAGALPERAGTLTPASFRAAAPMWLAPPLYGRFDPTSFRTASLDPTSPG